MVCPSLWNDNQKILMYVLGIITTSISIVQLFPYVKFLRMSSLQGAEEYIVAFTFFGFLNLIYIWHNIRLISMVSKKKCSRRKCGTSKVWFYSALCQVIATAIQVVWWYYVQDRDPLINSVVALPFTFIFFVFGTRRIHKINNVDETRINDGRGIELVPIRS